MGRGKGEGRGGIPKFEIVISKSISKFQSNGNGCVDVPAPPLNEHLIHHQERVGCRAHSFTSIQE